MCGHVQDVEVAVADFEHEQTFWESITLETAKRRSSRYEPLVFSSG
jgi:hypothetical protein